ncbi:MAG: c-type cytochrome [Salibacteraceae bacterium]
MAYRCTDPSKKGKRLYEVHCANCHGEEGQGLAQLYPPLANSDYLEAHATELPCIILNGIEGEILVNGVSYNQQMLGHPELSDAQIANITNYVVRQWVPSRPAPTPKDLKAWADGCN